MQFKMILLMLLPLILKGQPLTSDTINLLPVNVSSIYNRPILRLPSSISVVDSLVLLQYHGQSESAALNTIAGVRMEERSPGSYRLSIRGSLLRSPFGVRNVKIYIDDFPLTDAGGNTYFNVIDVSSLKSIQILKGPDGSLYGSNSGGVIRLIDQTIDTNISIGASAAYGSYAQFNQQLKVRLPIRKHLLSFNESLWEYGGYRQNSSFNRWYFRLGDIWSYNQKGWLKFMLLHSQISYLTPGGLTLEQWKTDQRLARQATNSLPGALEQKAGVENKGTYIGLQHNYKHSEKVNSSVSLFGSTYDFKNRFITNIETREEENTGVRATIKVSNNRKGQTDVSFLTGIEAQHSIADVANYGNNQGIRDTLQVADVLKASYLSAFASLTTDINNKYILVLSAGYNLYNYHFQSSSGLYQEISRFFKPYIMPRFAVSYLIIPELAVRASVGRGFSVPSFNEVRSSDNRINKDIYPEHGINYETGLSASLFEQKLKIDISLFYFPLQDAIVRKTNESGEEFFINAGKVRQPGLESHFSYDLDLADLFKLTLNQDITIYRFTFDDYYSSSGTDLSGKKVTGIPGENLSTSVLMTFPSGLYFHAGSRYTSIFPLNDENTVFSSSTNVLYMRAGISGYFKTFNYSFYFVVDNITNAKYSLGYDLNAFGGRYYNAAPGRSFMAGVIIR